MAELREIQELFAEVNLQGSLPKTSIHAAGVKIDSREVEPGDIYIAILGTRHDGHQYIDHAASQGAAAVVGSKPAEKFSGLNIPYLKVGDTRAALAQVAAAWHHFPAKELVVIGVTGTDGKTTTANLVYRILISAGYKAGMISTVNAVIGDQILDTGFHVTTPEAMDIQNYLAQMVAAGITHVVLETTSHGLAQKRVASCEYDIGLVTNITHEHLDYHGDYQGYQDAKAELFNLVAGSTQKTAKVNKLAVINANDESYPNLKEMTRKLGLKTVDYAIDQQADFVAARIASLPSGLSFDLINRDRKIPIKTSLLGEYNVSNCLAAAAACRDGLEIRWKDIQRGIEALDGIPGRMERIDLGQDFLVVVDFAHTPNALSQTLKSGKQMTVNKVIAVFGSAGLRDREKRRLMAETSAREADLTILTAEDPRTESLDEILGEMAAGAEAVGGIEGESFWRVVDRGDAIKKAYQLAGTGDLVLICGKGHEQSMCFGEIEYPWDDRIAARAGLAELLGKEGPTMPYLPTRD